RTPSADNRERMTSGSPDNGCATLVPDALSTAVMGSNSNASQTNSRVGWGKRFPARSIRRSHPGIGTLPCPPLNDQAFLDRHRCFAHDLQDARAVFLADPADIQVQGETFRFETGGHRFAALHLR